MDSLNDILSRKDLDEPAESAAIRHYVERKFQSLVSVTVHPTNIIITGESAALISTLRLQSPQLQKEAKTTKNLTFRIGTV
jgi:hypothetical protein